MQKFIEALKYRIKKLKDAPTLEINATDLLRAEVLWMKDAQLALTKERGFETWKRQFDLFLDEDGLFRCKGRLGNADVPTQTRHPILLPKHHQLTILVVRSAHRRVMHNGVRETLAEIRTKYWIIRGRKFVRQLIHTCVVCRKFDGAPYRPPPPPP